MAVIEHLPLYLSGVDVGDENHRLAKPNRVFGR